MNGAACAGVTAVPAGEPLIARSGRRDDGRGHAASEGGPVMIRTGRAVPKPGGKIVLRKAVDGGPAADIRVELETVWLSKKQMPELFDAERSVLSRHLRSKIRNGELDKDSACAFSCTYRGRRKDLRHAVQGSLGHHLRRDCVRQASTRSCAS